jgi:putative membrane protein
VKWAAGIAVLAVITSWPLADLAAHWSLTALLVQRVVLTVVVAPLLLMGTPPKVLAALTRPRAIDEVLAFVTRPASAVVIFTSVSFGSLLSPSVSAQSSSLTARAAFDVLILCAGFVLWGPVLRNIPGASRPTPIGAAAYLFVQSVIPGFPVVIFVFSKHSFYPSLSQAHRAIGLSPLADQQLAAVLGKVAMLPILWSVAWRRLSTAATEDSAEPTPRSKEDWQIEDVERHLERSARNARPETPDP